MPVAAFRTSLFALASALAMAAVFDACSNSPAGPTPPALKVTAISPTSGSTTGGTVVTVTGTEFGPDVTLTIGGVPATNVILQGSTSLSATTAPQTAAGPGDVVVSSGGKSATLARGFTFYAPTGSNRPPAIDSVQVGGQRPNQPASFANVGDAVALTPSISNEEASSLLQFAWSGEGSFSPASTSGATTWRLPDALESAPQPLTATLIVSETFTENGVTHVQQSAPYQVVLHVHDSQKEVMDMGEDFLTLFTRQLSPDEVLHNFSPSCDGGKGRSDEANDTKKNNDAVIEDFSAYRISRRPGFSLNFKSSCPTQGKPPQPNVDACSSFSVHWEGTDKSTKARFSVNGIDFVSAVLENNQWRLCHSTFAATDAYPSLAAVMPLLPQ